MARITLSTTGYVVVQESTRDGEQPDPRRMPTLVFLPTDDEATARRLFDRETESLERYAPSNVEHRRRLVYRRETDGADDVVLAEATTRGAGAPYVP